MDGVEDTIEEGEGDRNMPIGNPKPSTIACKKYQDKVGLIPKTYKLSRELTESFKKTCELKGESQSAVLTKLMSSYIDE